jgi:hypothetical protein
MMDLALLLSVIGIPLLVLLSWALGMAKTRPPLMESDFETARLEAAPDAQILAHEVFNQGRDGLARLSDGRLMVLRRMGADVCVRVAPGSAVRLAPVQAGFALYFSDAGFPPLKIAAPTPNWLSEALT